MTKEENNVIKLLEAFQNVSKIITSTPIVCDFCVDIEIEVAPVSETIYVIDRLDGEFVNIKENQIDTFIETYYLDSANSYKEDRKKLIALGWYESADHAKLMAESLLTALEEHLDNKNYIKVKYEG